MLNISAVVGNLDVVARVDLELGVGRFCLLVVVPLHPGSPVLEFGNGLREHLGDDLQDEHDRGQEGEDGEGLGDGGKNVPERVHGLVLTIGVGGSLYDP